MQRARITPRVGQGAFYNQNVGPWEPPGGILMARTISRHGTGQDIKQDQ